MTCACMSLSRVPYNVISCMYARLNLKNEKSETCKNLLWPFLRIYGSFVYNKNVTVHSLESNYESTLFMDASSSAKDICS